MTDAPFDYLAVDDDLPEEARRVRDTARDFLADEAADAVGDWYLDGEFPTHLIEPMGELGFYAPNLPYEGFPDLGEHAYGVLMRELEACDTGLRSFCSVQGALVMYPIWRYGTDGQQERYLPGMRDGDLVGCFGLTEPEHGSEPSAMETRAERDGDGWRLHGTKTWITNAPIADVALVWAKARESGDPSDAGPDDVRGFLVDTDADGFEASEIPGKLSLRVSSTGRIDLDGVSVPDEDVLDVQGMGGPLSCLNQARTGIAWGAVGAARDCFEEALAYAQDREQWGRPIGGFQMQQEKLAEMATQVSLGQLLARRLSTLKERDAMRPQHVSMAKRHNVRTARRVSRTAREMLGGNGITVDYSPMRHMQNVETVYTYEGTHDVHSLILGADLTGERAFRG